MLWSGPISEVDWDVRGSSPRADGMEWAFVFDVTSKFSNSASHGWTGSR